jgi:hypothetical protein
MEKNPQERADQNYLHTSTLPFPYSVQCIQNNVLQNNTILGVHWVWKTGATCGAVV